MNRFYLIVEQMACRWLEGIAGYVENQRETRCPQGTEGWQEVILSLTRVAITV